MTRTGVRTMLRLTYHCRPDWGGCGARPGQHCHTRAGGQNPQVHAARWNQYLNPLTTTTTPPERTAAMSSIELNWPSSPEDMERLVASLMNAVSSAIDKDNPETTILTVDGEPEATIAPYRSNTFR